MTVNETLIETFYKSFYNKDYETMQKLYSDNAVFSDAVFKNLNAQQVRAMWEMLIKKGADLKLEYKNIKSENTRVEAEWNATYTFTQTKRKVINKIKAQFIIENGKIIQHTDHFDFYLWARQAFGFTGILLGWTPFFKNKVQRGAMKALKKYMKSNS